MEWFCSNLGLNSTHVSQYINNAFNLTSSSASSWLRVLRDSALLSTEQLIIYTFNGDYQQQFQQFEQLTTDKINSTLHWLDFTPFQIKLLWEFSLIFAGNSLLVLLAWWIYGERIKNKFMRTQTKSSVEELRISFNELKLPQEMDFKFK